MRLLPAYQKGNYLEKEDRRIRYRQCKRIIVFAKVPTYASVDGEMIRFTKLEIETEMEGISFLMPKGVEPL